MVDAARTPREARPYAHGILRGDVHVYDLLGSTNTELKARAAAGAPEGLVLVADAQDAGRGRFDRSWSSPAGAGLYASVLLRPALPPHTANLLTFAAAIAVAEAVSGLGAAGVEIKWPNDVLLGGRKACGILTEASFAGDHVEWAVVGVGVNLRDEAVPRGLEGAATSLEAAGVRATSLELLDPVLASLARSYELMLERGAGPVLARWTELAPTASGRRVSVDDGTRPFEGVTGGVTPEGHLIVRRDGGAPVEISAADVTLL
jgi:BirA family biotin operon repressor/biotin-[acetyl-CoA-carboxylase] ligase